VCNLIPEHVRLDETDGMKNLLATILVIATVQTCIAETFIVKDGKPLAEIVVSDKATGMQLLAAKELQTYVKKITGAELAIRVESVAAASRRNDRRRDAVATIYVGRSSHTDKFNIKTDDLKHGAYRVASGADWVAFEGPSTAFKPVEPWARSRPSGSGGRAEKDRLQKAWDKITGETYANPFHYVYPFWNEELQVWEFDDAGSLNAVYDFLRGLGVRWFYPGELGEVVPKLTDIPLPKTNKVVRPDFPLRKLGWWSKRISMTPDENLWNLRMSTNHGVDLIGLTQLCHGSKFVHLREEFKKANPECLAMYGGKRATDHKRTQGAPCLSSKEFFKHHLKYSRAVFHHYDEPLISIDVVDGYGRGVCECKLCEGKGTPARGWNGLMSDYVLGYVDRVARELQASHPSKKVSALSYGAYQLPPQNIESFPSNLSLWICQSRKSHYDPNDRTRALELRKAWLEKLPSKQLFIYEYYMANRPGGAWEGIPVYFPRQISEDLKSLKGLSSGEYIDLYQPHDRTKLPYDYLAISHLNLYVTTRLWWDAERDVDAMLEDYYEKFYGPAQNEMKTFIEYCEQNWHRMCKDASVIEKALALVTEARNAAGDTIYGKRVALAVQYVEPLKRLRDQLLQPREGPIARAVLRSANDLKVDGKLDEPFWKTVRDYNLKELQTGNPPTAHTNFRIVWLGDSLCLGVTCREPDMQNLKIGTTKKDDPNIWSGDVVEVLLETQFHAYYQIAISPSGAVIDLDREKRLDTLWSSGAEIATHHSKDAWTIEIRLPAAGENAKDIDARQGIAGKRPSETYPWYLNVCRQRIRGKETELTAWSPTGTRRFNVPKKFGKVYAK